MNLGGRREIDQDTAVEPGKEKAEEGRSKRGALKNVCSSNTNGSQGEAIILPTGDKKDQGGRIERGRSAA